MQREREARDAERFGGRSDPYNRRRDDGSSASHTDRYGASGGSAADRSRGRSEQGRPGTGHGAPPIGSRYLGDRGGSAQRTSHTPGTPYTDADPPPFRRRSGSRRPDTETAEQVTGSIRLITTRTSLGARAGLPGGSTDPLTVNVARARLIEDPTADELPDAPRESWMMIRRDRTSAPPEPTSTEDVVSSPPREPRLEPAAGASATTGADSGPSSTGDVVSEQPREPRPEPAAGAGTTSASSAREETAVEAASRVEEADREYRDRVATAQLWSVYDPAEMRKAAAAMPEKARSSAYGGKGHGKDQKGRKKGDGKRNRKGDVVSSQPREPRHGPAAGAGATSSSDRRGRPEQRGQGRGRGRLPARSDDGSRQHVGWSGGSVRYPWSKNGSSADLGNEEWYFLKPLIRIHLPPISVFSHQGLVVHLDVPFTARKRRHTRGLQASA